MRSALLFALRLLIPAIVLAYVLAMLSSSCLPISDATGQAQSIPRWEYWLLHASVPSAIWWQWTGGLQPVVISDRMPILILAVAWLSECWLVGKLISQLDPTSARLSKYERIGVSILIGQSTLSTVVFLYGSLFGTHSLAWPLALVFAITIILLHFRSRPFQDVTSIETGSLVEIDVDISFASSISRRMVGLLFLATTFLACIQVYGATIPTHDMHVREVDWWLAKHATLDGRIRWAADNTLVNDPAGFAMPSLAFINILTWDLPSVPASNGQSIEQRERWNNRLYLGVLAGKTANAMLCLVGILLAGVHLGRRWGYLPGLFICFLLVATPGIAELTRLGRTEALIGIWGSALLVVLHASKNSASRDSASSKWKLGLMWGFLLAGALSSSYGSAVVVGAPAIVLWVGNYLQPRSNSKSDSQHNEVAFDWSQKLLSSSFVVCVVLFAAAFYFRNLVASGDPIYPWSGVVARELEIVKQSEMGNAIRYAYRVPSETTFESIASASSDLVIPVANEFQSPYRWANLLDGVFRLLWNSNAHGLMLVPFAIVGIFDTAFFSRNRKPSTGNQMVVIAIIWYVYWVSMWWFFSTRQDRDWVGAMILLAWPAANGAHWIARQARGYFMMSLVLIGIVWSVVVIPIWPTSDNRMLVALQSMDRTASTLNGSKWSDEEVAMTKSFSGQFNAFMRGSDRSDSPRKVLLIGENDDFELLTDSVSNGFFSQGWMDKWNDLPARDAGLLLRSHGISHLLVVWSGVQYRERLTGIEREKSYRLAIGKLLVESQLTPIPWEINSSHAELFRVNEK